MATTLIHPDSSAAPRPTPGGVRVAMIRANLMPDEVLIARRTEVLRRHILIGLAGVLALLIAWYGFTWLSTKSSENDLEDATHRTAALQAQQNKFAPLVAVQGQASTIQSQLHNLMAGDVQWRTMLANLRAKAGAGVQVTNVTSTLSVGGVGVTAGATTGPGLLNVSGKQAIGTLTVQGTAGTKSEIAGFVDRLASVKGLAAPLLQSVTTTTGKGYTFTVAAVLTTDALGGRYTPPATAPTTNGGH